jgi:flagellar protein FliO/FliZ
MSAPLAATAPLASSSILGTLFALAVVLVLILVLAWLLRKLQSGSLSNAGPIKVISSASIGMKERVVLVEVADEQLLLGVTASRVELLHRLTTRVQPALPASPFLRLLHPHVGAGSN